MLRGIFFILWCIGISGHSVAQDSTQVNLWNKWNIRPVVALQVWATYTTGQEVYDMTEQRYQAVDDRLNLQLRRSRLGFKGQPTPQIKFDLTVAIDLAGRDVLAATYGGSNNGSSPITRLWNAYVQWKVFKSLDAFHLTAGYFPPRIGRASITNPWKSTSLEKSWSQNYLRRHLTGIGPGRANGVNLGGLVATPNPKLKLYYDLAVFNPLYTSLQGNSSGIEASPLFVGRFSFQFGQAEHKTYSLGHKVNYFGKRRGLSVALAGTRQGKTDLFQNSQMLSVDFLFNWDQWNLDGEWSWAQREALHEAGTSRESLDFQMGYFRISRNFKLKNAKTLELVAMITKLYGSKDTGKQALAAALKSFAGEDGLLDIGFNYYPYQNVKLALHYNWQLADRAATPEGAQVNNYLRQSGVGAIYRGDYLGLGLSFAL
jgi:hypothetical protein